MTRVLIVDDNLENRYLLQALMQGSGFEVIEADNGAEALAEARRQPPDLVITDLLMPVMDGYRLLHEWRRDPILATIPFIVYTATYTEPKDEKLALDLGADVFIVKPSDPEPFVQQVRQVLAKAQRGALLPPREPIADEHAVLKLYNEVLIQKLEDKCVQLEQRIAELDTSQERIQRLNRLYLALKETSQAIVQLRDRNKLFETVCRVAVEHGGFAMAWVGMLNPDTREIIPAAQAGVDPQWFSRLRPFTLRGPRRTPVEIALGEGRVYLCNDLESDPALTPIRGALRDAGLSAAASCPLRIDRRVVGALTLFSAEKNYFDDSLRDLITEMADDVSYALENFEKEEQRQYAEAQLRASEAVIRLNSQAIESTANGIMITSIEQAGQSIIYVNPAFERITGYTAAEVVGRNPGFLQGDDVKQLGVADIALAIRERREAQAVLRNYRKDGSLFWNELSIAPVRGATGEVTHFVGVMNDITDRMQYEEQLERQNNEDALTGLASRNLLRDRTAQAIAFAARHERSVALLFLDLDNFKRVNDSLGHGSGDAILRTIAHRIKSSVGPRDTPARLGGDDFVIALSDLSDPQDVTLMVNRILRELAQPVSVGGRDIRVSASIGVSVFPQDGNDYETLLRNADVAMYSAKQAGRNTFRFYTTGMNEEALHRLDLESKLRQALSRGEFILHYQPLVRIADGQIEDVEALLRCRDGDGRLMLPAEFIPLAEDSDLIVPIGEWAIQNACRQVQLWRQQGCEVRVAVNLSARQFRDRNLVHMVRCCLDDHRVPPELLKLEITESTAMENAEQTAGLLAELKALGVGLSIDDFGTGYSSLAYLRRFPIDQLKIDRTFVHDMLGHPDNAAIVLGIIGLARNLRLQTVAEGVETEQQRDYLREIGCDLMQGFYFSRPLPPDELPLLLKNGGTREPRKKG